MRFAVATEPSGKSALLLGCVSLPALTLHVRSCCSLVAEFDATAMLYTPPELISLAGAAVTGQVGCTQKEQLAHGSVGVACCARKQWRARRSGRGAHQPRLACNWARCACNWARLICAGAEPWVSPHDLSWKCKFSVLVHCHYTRICGSACDC